MRLRSRTKTILLLVAALLSIFCIGLPGGSEVFAQKSQALSSQEKLEAEKRLWDLGYWAGPVDGRFDSGSRHALIAFQKVERLPRTGNLTLQELNALRNATRPLARYGRYAHVEIDLERQVLFVVGEDGEVMRILPVSTGSGKLYMDRGQIHRARTPTGSFKVQRKINGWRVSTLGLLYYPSYILNGIAIHGSPSIPTRPASHGCIRVPMFTAKELSSILPIGIQVLVYNGVQSAH